MVYVTEKINVGFRPGWILPDEGTGEASCNSCLGDEAFRLVLFQFSNGANQDLLLFSALLSSVEASFSGRFCVLIVAKWPPATTG